MELLSITLLASLFKNEKETSLSGRWIRLKDIEPLLLKLGSTFKTTQIGTSENNRPIYSIAMGSGSKKILVWSQMHGNESTGTKAVFDVLNVFKNSKEASIATILSQCTLLIVPMLNPDGAEAYTRVNAHAVDLNRDAVARTAIESKLLRTVLESFNPDFSFNLHDQRTLFGVENSNKPATISFLAPSEEATRALTKGRKETMNVIVSMHQVLQQVIPGAIGRYTDEFYPTATGDNFQQLGYNTILIEAGHYPEDYQREETRKYNFFSLLQGMYHIATNEDFSAYEAYFEIPNNEKSFYDVIHRHSGDKNDVAYQYEEKIIGASFVFELQKVAKKIQKGHKSHYEIVFES